jgi:hypothetical protein
MTSGMVGPGQGPMTVGRLLDRIWTILRGHARLFVRLGVMPAVSMLVLYGVMFGCFALAGLFQFPPPQQLSEPQRLLWIVFPAMLIAMVPMMVVFALFQGATCDAAIAVNRGIEPACGDLYRRAWSKTGRYTWLVLLSWLILMAPMLVGFALIVVGGMLAGPHNDGHSGAWFVLVPLIVLLYVGGVVYMIWMMLRIGLAFPACVAEDLTALEAVQRSGRLTVKAKGRMFLVLLVEWVISYAVMMVLEIVGMAVLGILILIGSALHMQMQEPVTIAALVLVGIILMGAICLLSMLMWSAYAVGLSVLYEDQVFRIDGPTNAAAMSGAPA